MVGSFHLHMRHHSKKQQGGGGGGGGVPKGCLAVKVGPTGEEQERVVVPVVYFNHPLFMRLLKEAEEEYGFDQKGTITIPCHVAEFRYVQGLIDRETHKSSSSLSFRYHDDHHHNPMVGCFRA